MPFKIPTEPKTMQKNIRFPTRMINEVEEEIKNTNCTFTGFVVSAVQYVLDEMHNNKEL